MSRNTWDGKVLTDDEAEQVLQANLAELRAAPNYKEACHLHERQKRRAGWKAEVPGGPLVPPKEAE